MHAHELKALALSVLDAEAEGIKALQARIDDTFVAACALILASKGRVVVTGIGKSGHIANKIAATLASTGTPAFFLHAAEAGHGDLGMITGGDVVLALSNSGETAEVLTIVPLLKRIGAPLIAMTGRAESSLAQQATVHIDVSVAHEACPLGLAPTTSTTAALAMGDALAVALLQQRGFTSDDFARSHPGGNLGKQLLLRASDLMHREAAIPQVTPQSNLATALLEITAKGLGMTAIVEASGKLRGIFTDGDLRRALDHQINLQTTPITDVMTANCITVPPEMLAAEVLHLMESKRINALLVTDPNNHLIGALNMHDLLSAGIV